MNNSYSGNGKKGFGSPKRLEGGPRRSVSHDGATLRRQFQGAQEKAADVDDDGFTTIGLVNKKKGGGGGGGGRFANDRAAAAAGGSSNRTPPRGRLNPASSFSRPRPQAARSFNKPRPGGSFKNPRDGSNNNNPNNQNNGRSRTPNRSNNNDPSKIFSRPRPSKSFDPSALRAEKQKNYKRSTSKMSSHDVELFLQGDGFNQSQQAVIRIHVDTLLQMRLQHLDPPSFGGDDHDATASTDTSNNADDWGPHPKCLWNDPTRREQIEQVMQQYPNAIPLSMKKRTRIRSTKLGDASHAAGTSGSSLVLSPSALSLENATEAIDPDESSIGNSIHSSSEQRGDGTFVFNIEQEDMNPLRKTLLLLNKLSWTTIDKLTPRLFDILEVDVPKLLPPPPTPPECDTADSFDQENNSESGDSAASDSATATVSPMVLTILHLLVEKAQTEPHFSAMYATLCQKLSARNPLWKKKILAHCQAEFEHDIVWHVARLEERLAAAKNSSTNKMTDGSMKSNASINTVATEDMDREYQVLQVRKKYMGHVQFIGELFKLKLIKPDIMIWCLSRLLFHRQVANEDDLDCFAQLMSVVGKQLEDLVKLKKCHCVAEEKWYQCWDRVYFLTGREKKKTSTNPAGSLIEEGPPPKISSRIKFKLVDLLELEENDWVHRRKHEKPKTIAEIHEEVREEEAEARRRSYSDDFGGTTSFGNRRRGNSGDNYQRSPQFRKSKVVADSDGFSSVPKRGNAIRRAQSEELDVYNKQQPTALVSRGTMSSSSSTPRIVEYPDPDECKEKAKTILKEYFVGGDTEEAIRSIDELVGAGSKNEDHGSVDRGAAVIESGVLLVMEMKQQEVQKFLAVIKRCLQQEKIERESLPLGLKDPLEFLRDVEIDAPLACSLLTSIVSYWVRQDVLSFDFLLEAPEYFRTDGRPAEFAAGVLKMRGDEPSDADLTVVEKLMSEGDKDKFSSAKEMLDPVT